MKKKHYEQPKIKEVELLAEEFLAASGEDEALDVEGVEISTYGSDNSFSGAFEI